MPGDNSTQFETWRPVLGYEQMYEVSSLGAVRSCDRQVRKGGNSTRLVRSRYLTMSNHACGYLAVFLQKSNESTGFLVHRLVAAAFIGPIALKLEVNHKDGDKKNNRLDNLEIVTRQENIDHAVRLGLIANKGEKNSQARLTESNVIEIRSLYESKWGGYKAISKRFGCSWELVRNIVKRQNWKHIAP